MEQLSNQVATLQASMLIQSRLLPGTFFKRWYMAFLVVFVVIAVAVTIMAVRTNMTARNVGYIADVLEGSTVLVE